MTLMFQKEVARRIVANPGSGDYGRLSVVAQALCETSIVMDLPARAFTPPPKVDSAIVRLVPLPDREPTEARVLALQKVTHAAFGQRRKMLRALPAWNGRRVALSIGRNRPAEPGRDGHRRGVPGPCRSSGDLGPSFDQPVDERLKPRVPNASQALGAIDRREGLQRRSRSSFTST